VARLVAARPVAARKTAASGKAGSPSSGSLLLHPHPKVFPIKSLQKLLPDAWQFLPAASNSCRFVRNVRNVRNCAAAPVLRPPGQPVGRLARRILTGLVVCLAATVALFAPPLAAGEEEARERGEWRIRVSRDQWGSATRAEVHDVLVATARELQVFFPARSAEAILVERSPGVPMVLYKRNGDGEYVIHLTVSGRRWAEYAYEFAHELCHIYANYQQRPHSAAAPHQWFEEALCETVSLFVLRRMGRRWQERGVAYGAYAPLFFEYAELLLNEPHRHGALALAPWYAANASRLSRTIPTAAMTTSTAPIACSPCSKRSPRAGRRCLI
jgi:hypothetical protein